MRQFAGDSAVNKIQKKIGHILSKPEDRIKSAAVIMVDVDNFDDLNSAYGYKFGDKLLKNIEELLSLSFHRGEILSQYEGDCFVIFISSIKGAEEAANIAKKIIRMFHMPWSMGALECYSTVSVGISIFPEDGHTAEILVKNAEAALNHAQRSGRERYQIYSKTISNQISKRLNIEYHLRRAVEREEFTLYYQPQIDISTGSVVSVEALIRWVSEARGIIPPSDFIPVAEETGLINDIGKWVLKTACKQIGELNRRMQTNLMLAVNLSPCQLQDRTLSDDIIKTIESTQFNPELLEIEVTEEAAIKDINATVRILEELGSRNIKIALDDFCTGYSSLCYLEMLPINKIKIDRSFIMGMNDNYKKEFIVESLINLAHRLGNVIVAEGVEQEAQLNALKQKNCDIVQGYYFSKPLPYDEIIRYVGENAVRHPA